MTREEFQGHVVAVFSSAMSWRGESGIYWPHGDEHHYKVSWCTGGMMGGNCWGDSADHAVEADQEPDMTLLDELLEHVAPRMTIKQYKQLLQDVVVRDTRNDYEYYGNYTINSTKTVHFDSLYEALSHMGHV